MTARTSIPDHSTLGSYFITEGFVAESICKDMSMLLDVSFGWGCWGGQQQLHTGYEGTRQPQHWDYLEKCYLENEGM